jgi:pimeloyl-ACP methyl ester carboxylesterase
MTTVLTLEPWWPGRGVTKKLFERKVCAAATVVEVTKGPDSIDDGLQELVDALAANQDDEVIVFGYSRGAQIIGRWLARYADAPDAPDPDRVTFLCCGNPERKFGGVPWMAKDRTRNDSRFRVTDVKLQYDSWCDWPAQTAGIAGVMARSTLLGVTVHLVGYLGADLDDLGRKTYTENTTTYVMIPHDIPRPWRGARTWIEAAYDRPEKSKDDREHTYDIG